MSGLARHVTTGGLGEAQTHGFVERRRDEPIRFDEVEFLGAPKARIAWLDSTSSRPLPMYVKSLSAEAEYLGNRFP